jgi:hypothetical protein
MTIADSSQKPQPVSGNEPERRRTTRYQCDGYALVCTIPSSGTPQKCKINNLSLGGCHLEFASPYPPATRLELTLHVNRLSLRMAGVVRSRRSGGMGIEFGVMSTMGRHDLAELIREFKLSAEKL